VYSLRRAATAALACLMLSVVPASAVTTIDTGVSSTLYSCQWGFPNTATYGQTITVPANDSLLDGFSFHVMQFRDGFTGLPTSTPATIAYRAYIYKWTGSMATGSAVWTSGPQALTTTAGSAAAQEVAFNTNGLALDPGAQYVAFLSVSEDYAANTTGDKACFANAATSYSGGSWAFLNNAGDASKWTTTAWSLSSSDLAFKASFSAPAPPPPTTIYEFDGFYAPVNNRDADGRLILNEVRAGRAIPLKFSLGGDYGLDVFAEGYPKSEVIACDSDAEVDGVEQTVEAGASALSYDPDTGTYIYVWKTDTSWDDSCRQLVVKFGDGTTARANFKFKP
jgi:hypothetical protein